jgi:hypothetical protein
MISISKCQKHNSHNLNIIALGCGTKNNLPSFDLDSLDLRSNKIIIIDSNKDSYYKPMIELCKIYINTKGYSSYYDFQMWIEDIFKLNFMICYDKLWPITLAIAWCEIAKENKKDKLKITCQNYKMEDFIQKDCENMLIIKDKTHEKLVEKLIINIRNKK